MTRPTDEQLMSYADGLLAPEEMREMERRIAGDADALRLVENFRRTRVLLADAYAQPFQEAPPSRLVEAIMKAPAGGSAGSGTPITGRLERSGDGCADDARVLPFPMPRRPWPVHLALAASMIFALGFGAASLLSMPERSGWGGGTAQLAVGPVPLSSTLANLLEHRGGGEITENDRVAPQVLVVATFKDGTGRYCRELELIADSRTMAPLSAAIACREPNGWVVEGAARVASLDATGGYRPASATTKDVMRNMERLLGLGEPLSAEEETLALARQWR